MEANAATSFPRRFEVRYSLDEALRYGAARSRNESALAGGSGHSWARLIVLAFLVSGLALLAQALGSLSSSAVPFMATLLALAFVGGVYAGWMEIGRLSKRTAEALHAADGGFGPWAVVVADDALEASTRGYSFRLLLADLQDVAVDDAFVIMTLSPAWDFAVPVRCLGGDEQAQAFKRFLDRRRAGTATPRP